jgi:hypothetical protein
MTGRAPLVAAVLFAIVAWSVAPAHACRPLASWLERTLRQVRPSHGGLPDDAFEKLFRDVGAPPFYARPTSGPVPLVVRLAFNYRPLPEPVSVEITIVGAALGGRPTSATATTRATGHSRAKAVTTSPRACARPESRIS